MCRHSCLSGQDVILIHVGNKGFGHENFGLKVTRINEDDRWGRSQKNHKQKSFPLAEKSGTT